jgi:hypothetical protein
MTQTIFKTKEEARIAFWKKLTEANKLPWWRFFKGFKLEGEALEIIVNNDLV